MSGQFSIDLSACRSKEQLIAELKSKSGQLRSGTRAIVGHQCSCLDGLMRADLDANFPDKPVILYRHCLHKCLVNSATLALFGLLPGPLPHPEEWTGAILTSTAAYFASLLNLAQQKLSDFIELDDSGIPTGILNESALFKIKEFLYMHLDEDSRRSIFVTGLNKCLTNGITTVQTNDFYGAWSVYRKLQDDHMIPLRVYLTVPFDEVDMHETDSFHDDEDGTVPLPDDQYGLVSCHRVKLFADGSLGAKTAALREPYHDSCTHSRGLMIHSEQELYRKVEKARDLGYRLEIHVIGDRAVEAVLDTLEHVGIGADDRPILTHCQILGPDLITRMSRLQVIANVQPSFVTTDAKWVSDRLGNDKARLKHSYCWKRLLDANVPVSGGSDAPVESCNPFLGLHAAIYRNFDITLEKPPSELPVFLPQERLSFEQAFGLYTTGGAFTAGDEDRIGRLEAGYKADFVVIDQEIWKSSGATLEAIDATWNLLRDVKVLQVWVDGQLRHSKS